MLDDGYEYSQPEKQPQSTKIGQSLCVSEMSVHGSGLSGERNGLEQ